MDPQTFTLADRAGTPHEYEIILHPGRAGARLSRQLLAGGLPAVVGGFTEQITPEALAAAVESFSDEVIADLVKHTSRDGKGLTGPAFDQAFQGNYGELYALLAEVIQRNGFLPVPDTLLTGLRVMLSELLSAASSALVEGAAEASERKADEQSREQPEQESTGSSSE